MNKKQTGFPKLKFITKDKRAFETRDYTLTRKEVNGKTWWLAETEMFGGAHRFMSVLPEGLETPSGRKAE